MPEELELPPLEELVAVPELLVPLEELPLPLEAPLELPEDEPVAPLLDVELPPDPLVDDPDEPPLAADPDAEPLPEDPDDPELPEDPDDPLLPEDPDPDPLLPSVQEGDVLSEQPYAIGLARTKQNMRRQGLIDTPECGGSTERAAAPTISAECGRATESVTEKAT
jgi:hypothetical protein